VPAEEAEGVLTMQPASLRTHSWYCLLEGVDSPQALAEVAAQQGYGSVALTDTNNVAGAVEFVEACRPLAVRPIVGARLVYGMRRCTVLVAEPSGFRNLCRVITRCNLGQADPIETLAAFSDGLHVLVDEPAALKPALLEAFPQRVWVEMARPGRSSQHENALVDAGVKAGARPVASLAARTSSATGYPTFRLVTAIRTGKTLADLPASLGVGRENHLASAAEVRERFRDQPGWLANAQALAERCRSDVLPRGSSALPVRLPHGTDALGHLTTVCDRAMTARNLSSQTAVRRRLAEELNVIGVLGLAAYFLACHELADEAKRQQWPFSLRGSAGASLVLYLLGLSDVEPVSHGLKFERFLNAARDKPPDVDVEFASHQRGKVLAWLIQRHGADHVARCGNYSHLRAVSSLKASLKLHGLSDEQVQSGACLAGQVRRAGRPAQRRAGLLAV
jgi:DNA polymerase III alpha subunit